jgi:hypothetical protein
MKLPVQPRFIDLFPFVKGTFLTNRVEPDLRFNLYSLSNFYVETSYKASENRIVDFSTFKKADRLDRYLDWIDLNEMLE